MSARKVSLAVLPLLALTSACAGGAGSHNAADQLAFGSRMAERGLWGEALFRFRQAGQMEPQNARAWNNQAVAYEATGRFEDALSSYKKALEIEPGNAAIKRNYARFVEFYQSFKPRGEQPPPAEKTEKPATTQLGGPPS